MHTVTMSETQEDRVGRAPAADGFRGGTIPMTPFVHALDAAMTGDTVRLRALVSTMTQRDRDHLAKSADRLAMAAEDDDLRIS